MKKLIVSTFVLMALLVGSTPASAQLFEDYYYGDPVERVIASNQRMVDRWSRYGGYYGYEQGGDFYAIYDRNGRPMSKPVKIAIAGMTGAAIGAAIDRCNRMRGGIIGGAVGVGAAILIDKIANRSNRSEPAYNGPEAVEVDPRQLPPPPPGGPAGYPQPQAGPRPTAGPMAGPTVATVSAQFRLINGTRYTVEVFDGQNYIGRLAPRTEMFVSAPTNGYQGYALIPNNRGSVSQDLTNVRATDNGWILLEPQFR